MLNHSELPWKPDGDYIMDASGKNTIAICPAKRSGDRGFIIHAANNYDAMRIALNTAINALQRVANITDETRLGWALKELDTLSAKLEQETKVFCPKCKNEIDPTVCWCGDPIKGHTGEHGAVPIGCDCGRVK